MAITIEDFIGGETGTVAEEWSVYGGGSMSIESTTVRTGSYSYKLIPLSTPVSHRMDSSITDPPTNDVAIGLAFRYSGTPSTGNTDNFITWGSSNEARVRLFTNFSDELVLSVFAGDNTFEDGTTALVADTWYYVEMYMNRHNTTGSIEVFLNGVSECSLTNKDTIRGTTHYASISCNSTALNNLTLYIDDLYQATGLTSTADLLGDAEVYGHVCDQTTNVAPYAGVNFGPSNTVGVIDNTAIISDTDTASYTASGAQGFSDGITLNAGIENDPIAALGYWRVSRSGGGGTDHHGVWGNDVDGNTLTIDLNPDTAFTTYKFLTESASIIPTATQELRLGFEKPSGGQDLVCAWMIVMLLHVPSASGTTHEGALTLANKLTQSEVPLWTLFASNTLALKLTQAEIAGWVTDAATTLGHNLTQAEVGGLLLDAAVTLNLKLTQAEVINAIFAATITLNTILTQAQSGALTTDATVTLLHQLAEAESTNWTVFAGNTLAHNLDQGQAGGLILLTALSLALKLHGPQGEKGNELNTDAGFDSASSWEEGIV